MNRYDDIEGPDDAGLYWWDGEAFLTREEAEAERDANNH